MLVVCGVWWYWKVSDMNKKHKKTFFIDNIEYIFFLIFILLLNSKNIIVTPIYTNICNLHPINL